MKDQAAAATILQPRSKVTDVRFADPDEGITKSTYTDQESHLLPEKTEGCSGSAERQRDPQVGNFETKHAFLREWQTIVDLYLL